MLTLLASQRGRKVSCKHDMNIHGCFRRTWWNNQRSNLFCRKNSCFSLCFWAWIKLLFPSPTSSVGITDVHGLFLLSGTFKPPKLSLSCLLFSLLCLSPVYESVFRLLWKESWHVRNGVLTRDGCVVWRICDQEKACFFYWVVDLLQLNLSRAATVCTIQ